MPSLCHRAMGNRDGAVREYRALVAGKPLDQADSNYRLALAYKAAGKPENLQKSGEKVAPEKVVEWLLR